MSNEIFLDSSVLIEYRKNNQTDLLDALLKDAQVRLCMSQVVVSEYLFHHLAVFGQKSPLSLKVSNSIAATLLIKDPLPFLELFSWLPDDAAMLALAVKFMSKYNLLPNDALILAACKQHGISAIASFDPDFSAPCQVEGIQLLQSVSDFQKFRQSA